MKKVIWLATVGLVLGVGLTSAQADMYRLDLSTAQSFVQQNTPGQFTNQLFLVIDAPGTLGSSINWQVDGDWTEYGSDTGAMQLDVGFVGQLKNGQVMQIGTDGALPAGSDSFGLFLANDDDDEWAVRPYVKGATYTDPGFTLVGPGSTVFVSLADISGTVTEFGFEVQIAGDRGSDNFHISAVPIPGAALLGLLGLTAAGVRLRRFV